MIRQRVRIRFRKQGDLRLIGHRDLVRTFERWFRRAGLRLSMSEGFHPKARMSFPSALALGIEGVDEVMEFELAERADADQLMDRLSSHSPPGLTIADLRLLSPDEGKAQVRRMTYVMPIPELQHGRLNERMCQLSEQSSYLIQRDGHKTPVDLKAGLDHLQFDGGVLQFRLNVGSQGSVRPKDVLEALGLDDLETEGCFLTRTAVELAPQPYNSNEETKQSHEKGNVDQCVAAGRVPDCDH
jgi:radical SAM-linked protein